MKIIVVGVDKIPHLGASFRNGLERLGHQVRLVDERWSYSALDLRPFRWFTKRVFNHRPSGRALFRTILLHACRTFQPDMILAIKGSTLDPELLSEVRTYTKIPLVLYCSDNHFNPIVSTKEMIEALPLWDVVATPRRTALPTLRERCRGQVLWLPFGYDPTIHYPVTPSKREASRYRSEVSFAGGCDLDRVPYLDPLAQCGELDVSFYGGGCYDSTPALRAHHKGIAFGQRYRLVLSTTKVAICLLRKANDDHHTLRTFEIPACGAFLLAERTDEHSEMFEEGREAVFFTDPEELADKAKYYVRHESERNSIARHGYLRVTGSHYTYADRLDHLIKNIG